MNNKVLHEKPQNQQEFQVIPFNRPTIAPGGLPVSVPVGLPVGLPVGDKNLTERDTSILWALKRHAALTALQVQLLLRFPSLDRAQRRCLVLYRKDLLSRMPCFFLTPHKAEYCYFLSRNGHQYLQLASMEKTGSQPARVKSVFFLNHLLLINQFWLYLELACRHQNLVRLDGFIPEFANRTETGKKATATQVPIPKTDKQAILIPDGVFCLSRQDKKKLFFVEIDRATGKVKSQNYRSFIDQVQKYIWYQQAKGFASYQELFKYAFPGFQVLYATTSENRIKTYQQALANLGYLRRFVLFTSFEKLSAATILEKIWRPCKSEDTNVYSLLD